MDDRTKTLWGMLAGIVGIGILEYWFAKRRRDAGILQ